MRHVGHTMATPEYPPAEAVTLLAAVGCDATELISMTAQEQGDRHGPAVGDAPIPSYEWPDAQVAELAAQADSAGVPVLTVTQYVRSFNSPDEAERRGAIDRMSRYIDFAARLGAGYVRVHGGAEGFGPESWPQAVESLRALAGVAGQRGIRLLLENHPGTLTVTGEASARMVREVNAPALRILYDPANVLCHSDEDYVRTFALQEDLIEYVHVKDFGRRAGWRIACPVGQGCVPWPEIIRMLRQSGFDGPLSYEYERKWNREQLPEPRVGLKQSIQYVRSLLEQ